MDAASHCALSIIRCVRVAAASASAGARGRVHDQVIAAEVVAHDRVVGRTRRPLFLVATHAEVVVVRETVREAMDQPRIAVVGEDDGLIGRERVRRSRDPSDGAMLFSRLQCHQIDAAAAARRGLLSDEYPRQPGRASLPSAHASPPGRRLRRRSARNRSLGTAARPPSAGCERTPSSSRSCSRSNEVSIASRLRVPDPRTFSNASWRRARRSPLRRLRRRRRLSGRVVEVGAVLVRERVLEFAPFVDRARRFRSGVIGDATRQREPPEQPCKLELAKLQVVGGAPVRVQSFQQARRQRCRHGESRKAMSGAEGVASSIR